MFFKHGNYIFLNTLTKIHNESNFLKLKLFLQDAQFHYFNINKIYKL